MRLARNALGIVAVASAVGCSSQHGATPNGTGNDASQNIVSNGLPGVDTGTVTGALNIAQGIDVTSLSWKISNGTGPGPYSGTANIGDGGSAEWVAGGIQAGSGYTIAISGTDSQNDPCSGTSAAFAVIAGQVVYEQVSVICLEPTDAQAPADVSTGSVAIEAGVATTPVGAYACPSIASFSINPAELIGAQPAALQVLISGGGIGGTNDAGVYVGTALTWSSVVVSGEGTPAGFVATDGGADTIDPNVTFECGSFTGQVAVAATLANDQIAPNQTVSSNVCAGANFTTVTGLINCEGGGEPLCFAPQISCPGDAGTITCKQSDTDNNNCGSCGNVCASGDTCSSGTCLAPPDVPCTGGGPGAYTPAGCFPCLGNRENGVCTRTEQVVVNYDIAKNHVTPTTNTTEAVSCYYCLVAGGCLDSAAAASAPTGIGIARVATHDEQGRECEDPTTATNVAAENPADCRDALTCTLTGGGTLSLGVLTGGHGECTSPAPPASTDATASLGNCYRGAASGLPCLTPGFSANGACETNITTDVGSFLSSNTPGNIILDLADGSKSPGGVGIQILNCGLSNNCDVCFE